MGLLLIRNMKVCNGGLQRSLSKLWRSRGAASANPAVSCEGSGSSISGQSGTGAMERSVAAAAGEGDDIAGDIAVAIPTGSACWMVRLLLLYLSNRPTSDCFREVVWLAMLSIQTTFLADGEAAASPCRVDKACTVGGGACEGSGNGSSSPGPVRRAEPVGCVPE